LVANKLAKPKEKKFLKMHQRTNNLKVNGQDYSNIHERQESKWMEIVLLQWQPLKAGERGERKKEKVERRKLGSWDL